MILIIQDTLEGKALEIGRSLKKEIDNSLIISNNYLEDLIKSIFIDEDVIKKEDILEFESTIFVYLIRKMKERFNKNLIILLNENTVNLNNIKDRVKKLDEEFYLFKIEEIMNTNLNISTEEKIFIIYKDSIEEMKKRIIDILKISKKNFREIELLSNKNYLIKGNNVDINLLNSCHQSVKNVYKKKGFYEIVLEIHPLLIQQELVIDNLDMYISLDDLNEEEINLIKDINEKINNNEKELTNIIENTINYIGKFKEEENYNKKENMKNMTSIERTIFNEKGNIFELTKVFMSITRYCKIPTKLIFGLINKSIYHSWIEVYSESVGWIPVETKNNFKMKDEKYYFGITNKHIKLFEDVDFKNINSKIENLDIEVLTTN